MKKQTSQARDPRKELLAKSISEGTCAEVRNRYFSLLEAVKTASFGELDRDVVILDTETTGFSLNHDELIQIAAARMSKGKIKEWFVTFVNPGQPIPEEITHLTSINDSDVAEAPSPEEALSQLVEFVGTSDIVAHNAEFDRSFITKSMFGTVLLQNLWIDSLDLARIALPRLKSHRLIDLVTAFGAPRSTHRADADVEALCAIYRILLAATAAMPDALLEEIANMAEEEDWATVKIFKHFSRAEKATTTSCVNSQEEAISSSTLMSSEKLPESENQAPTNRKISPQSRNFSLRKMRLDRIKEVSLIAKPDADVIAADPQKGLTFPSEETLARAFTSEGMVGGLYENYETRQEQAIMAQRIGKAFSSSTNLAVEAGTGVGKSMAYLVPAMLTAKQNNITIGVATKTNTLLDQLVYKELPLIAEAYERQTSGSQEAKGTLVNSAPEKGGQKLDFTALKGFSHYPCLRKISRLVNNGPKKVTVNGKPVLQAPSLAALLSYIEQSEYSDMDALKIDYRALPRYTITTASVECLRRKCPFYGAPCFVHGARRRAEAADIVVTNHSLLFCDIAAEGGLLPPIRYWIIDEAHGAEAEARSALSLEISAEEVLRLSGRLASSDATFNPFIRAGRKAGSEEGNTLLFGQLAKAQKAAQAFDQAAEGFTNNIKSLAFFNANKRNKGYETMELWINDDIRASETFAQLASFGRIFCDAIDKLILAGQEVVGLLEDLPEVAEIQREIAATIISLKEMFHAAESILFSAPPTYAYAAVLTSKKDRIIEKMQALLINVGEQLNETLFANTHSIIFASATLTVADSFDSFEDALGLNESEFSQTATCQLASSYDFDSQMTVYVANDIPEPNDPTYLQALQKLLIQTHAAQEGSMLTLFTNRKEMEKCFEETQEALKSKGLRVACQKWGLSAKGLRDDFLADEHLSLFALKSFWEGFDAPGSTLKGVIIPKLPFAKPTDPLYCERALRDQHAWFRYVLPAAVLETKQATGRLIRCADDSGCVILADRRLLTKGYGKTFLKSMPSKTIKICSTAEIAQDLAALYGKNSRIQ